MARVQLVKTFSVHFGAFNLMLIRLFSFLVLMLVPWNGTALAIDPRLEHALFHSGAIVTSEPKLSISSDNAALSYIGDLNCGNQINEERCQSFILSCNFQRPKDISIRFNGIGVNYILFSNILKNANRLPFITYKDRLIRSYNRTTSGNDIAYNRKKSLQIANFAFLSAERLGDFEMGSYAIDWEIASPQDASRLLEMLSSGELLMLAHPESGVGYTFYHRLPPGTKEGNLDLAGQFATSCRKRWSEVQ